MPRIVFKVLWESIAAGNEIFAYVINSTKNGDYYWVIAHVTPSFQDADVIGYHSTRRVPNPQTIKTIIEPLYEKLKNIEDSNSSKKSGLEKLTSCSNDLFRRKKTII